MKPNIFNIATKELSQDAFITWLVLWADKSNEEENPQLRMCAIEFIRELLKKEIIDFDETIETVYAERQWENIDISVEVNNKYLIIIEDKTFTGQRSNQLLTYKGKAEKWCLKSKFHEPVCIYLKTGNESTQSLNRVINKGYKIYNRLDFLDLLIRHQIDNDIYNDFKERLMLLEERNNEWESKPLNKWGGGDWQGFYQYLEKTMNITGWDYVNNPRGGFWCAVLNWLDFDNYPIYLQIEEQKLCFKVSTHPDDIDLDINFNRSHFRNKVSNLIINFGNEYGIVVKRPTRFGHGNYMTVAVVDAPEWLGKPDEKIKKDTVVKTLETYITFLKLLIETKSGALTDNIKLECDFYEQNVL